MGVMDRVSKSLLGLTQNPDVILLLLNVMLIIAGMLLDAISIYYVFLPIFMPLMKQFNWDPVWFGVMMTVNLAIGTITPPVAVNLYVASNISKTPMDRGLALGHAVLRCPRRGAPPGHLHPRLVAVAAEPPGAWR